MDKTVIEIQDIVRKVINKKDGTQSTVVELVDGRSTRAASTWDLEWTAGWKVGDMVEVVWGTSKSWTDRSNKTHETWSITNPNAPAKKAWTPRPQTGAGGGLTAEQFSYLVAATLLAPTFVGKKIDFAMLKELSVKIGTETAPAVLHETAPAAVTAPVAAAAPMPVATPMPVAPAIATPVQDLAAITVEEEDDDDKPF